jgi:hypothetical protein
MVGTIYDPDICFKVAKMRKNFKGGKALFTMPTPPVKCAGAPQKVMYMCEDYWKKHNIKTDITYFTSLPQIFGVKYYSDPLTEIAKSRGINLKYTTVLQSIKDGVATFKNTTDNSVFEENFDFIHVTPPQGPPDFLKGSPVSNAAGFVDIGRDMRHKKYNNIWAIGDCIGLPNAKTAAAVFSEAPVLVYNFKQSLNKTNNSNIIYDGYSACPLFLKKYKLLMAEFREYPDEKGEIVRVPDESFDPGRQQSPKTLYYFITKSFTLFYPLALKGYWFGKHSLVKPIFPTPKDYRHYYSKLIKAIFIGSGIALIALMI